MVEILGHSCNYDRLGNRYERCFRCRKYKTKDDCFLIEKGENIIYVCNKCFNPKDEIVFLLGEYEK